ncbi:MAG: pyridoxamine 5'-phosphate oxidase family protein, partial [Methanobacterium sp.]|nr:pyridoxamine 5'-phosphate oxidase family protein [Methanobacterium sp.]
MVLTKEMMEAIDKNLVFVATVSKEGVPNVVPIG